MSIIEPDLSAETFDLIIVGSGSGNSIPSYLDDWNIAIVERDVFGGTCLNRGCIPSKMFVYPADVAVASKTSSKLGIDTQFNGADWSAIRDRVFGLIDPIASSGRDYRATGTPNVTLIEGTGRVRRRADPRRRGPADHGATHPARRRCPPGRPTDRRSDGDRVPHVRLDHATG